MNKHKFLLEYIRKYCEENTNPLGHAIQGDDSEVLRQLFLNYRESSDGPKGFRLTNLGLQYFKMCFQHWQIDFDSNFRALPKHVIFLDRRCKFPYHLYAGTLTLFDADVAMHLKLIGSLDIFMDGEKENKPSLLKNRA